ncbi:hypothetical protein [Azospirillum argentinense]
MPCVTMQFRIGQRVEIDGRICRFERHGPHGAHVFLDEESSLPVVHDSDALLRLIASRRLETVSDALPRSATGRLPSLDDIADPVLREATFRRLRYARAWKASEDRRRSEASLGALIERTAREHGDADPPAPSTLREWLKDWIESGENPLSLIPKVRERGNRTRRLTSEVLDIVRDCLEKVWLRPDRPTVVEVHAAVLGAITERNASLPADRHLDIPCLRTIYRERDRIDAFTRAFERDGAAVANHRFRPVASAPQFARHNQLWELDHTKVEGRKHGGQRLRCIIRDSGSGAAIGEAWITSAVDAGTRMPMGFALGFDPPSEASVYDCLRHAMLPKTYVAERYPHIRNTWPAFGLPGALRLDNGADVRSLAVAEACALLGVDIDHTPVGKSWFKGMIERFQRTLVEQVFQRVPGATFAAYFQKTGREPPPDEVATATLDELRMRIHEWLIDDFAIRHHRGLLGAPGRAWEESLRVHGMKPLPPRDLQDEALALAVYRVPQRYGIEVYGLLYNSADLAEIRVALAATGQTAVKVRIGPDDLSRVSLIHPSTGERVRIPVVERWRAYTQGLSLFEHRLIRALLNNDPERFAGDQAALLARDALRRSIDALRGRPLRRSVRNRLAQFSESIRRSEAAREAAAAPPMTDAAPISESLMRNAGIGDRPTVPSGPDSPEGPTAILEPGTAAGAAEPVPPDAEAPLAADGDAIDLEALRRRLGIRLDHTARDE